VNPSHGDNFVNRKDSYVEFLLQNLQVPKITASHLYSPTPLLDAVRHASRDSIFIFVYRKETDRLMSSIRQIAERIMCSKNANDYSSHVKKPLETREKNFGREVSVINGTETVTFDEEPFVTDVLKPRLVEVGFSIPKLLTCELWGELRETNPSRFFFVHFSDLDQVQANLASQYCPSVDSVQDNVAAKKKKQFVIRLRNRSLVDLDDWISAKKDHIEFALQTSGDRVSGAGSGSCKYHTGILEGEMSLCKSGILQWLPH